MKFLYGFILIIRLKVFLKRHRYLSGFRRHDFVPYPESSVTFVTQMICVRIGAGRMVFDERQPDRLMAETHKMIFARRVGRQRMSGTVQQSPVSVVERPNEKLALARVFRVARRFVIDEQYL